MCQLGSFFLFVFLALEDAHMYEWNVNRRGRSLSVCGFVFLRKENVLLTVSLCPLLKIHT